MIVNRMAITIPSTSIDVPSPSTIPQTGRIDGPIGAMLKRKLILVNETLNINDQAHHRHHAALRCHSRMVCSMGVSDPQIHLFDIRSKLAL